MKQQSLFTPKMRVYYEPNSIAFSWSDGITERQARSLARILDKSAVDITVRIANELSILAFRVLVKEGVIDHHRIIFHINNREYKVNTDGRFVEDIPVVSIMDDLFSRML